MIGFTTPGAAGFSQERIAGFLREMERRGISMHSVLMLKGNDIFFERYWLPFAPDMPHRMYSVTKSFVSIAIGCLLDEGKIHLDDPIVKYFPDKQPERISPYMAEQTIRHMLMMSTCVQGEGWFRPDVQDRTRFYFASKANRPAGTLYDYDSTGSYILGALVERLSGMPLLDYLKLKVLDRIGGFENAQILSVPDGTAWGDSAMICTPRALMNFARFVMNLGTWEGQRLLSEDYLRAATSFRVSNDLDGRKSIDRWGYGYQIWRNERGFSFHGMGGQYAICVPDEDFIFVCTGDNQLNTLASEVIFRAVFDILIPKEEEIPLRDGLDAARGQAESDFAAEISGRTFICDENPMGIKWFRLEFDGDQGKFIYENAQGEKLLPFGMKKNVFGKFPQLGYSDDRGNVHEINGFMYDCAASAGWIEQQKLQLRVQSIDRYFGGRVITFGFRDRHVAGVRMVKVAEDFLSEYEGWMAAHAESVRIQEEATVLEFRRPEERDIAEIESYKAEFLKASSSMDGTGILSSADAAEWLKYNREMECSTAENHVRSLQYGLFDPEKNRLLGLLQIRLELKGYLSDFGGHIGYCVRPSERRKGYARMMLRHALQICKSRGMTRVLITCLEDNVASAKTIESCGGKYEKTVHDDINYQANMKRYWICLTE